MEALNLFRKAKSDLLENFIGKMSDKFRPAKAELMEAINIATRAQKFILPFGGRIIDNQLSCLPKELNLPYPEMIIEYEITGGISQTEKIFGVEGTTAYSKRIIVAKQLENKDILIYSILFSEDAQQWQIQPFSTTLSTSRKAYDPAQVFGRGIDDDKAKMLDISTTLIPVGNFGPIMAPDWQERAYLDMLDESRALLELLEVLSCQNIAHEVLPKRKLNKQAMRAGALPFDEYRILVIKQNKLGTSTKLGDSNGRSTPREHLRRGHTREYESGLKIWIMPTVVNAGAAGTIMKEYSIK